MLRKLWILALLLVFPTSALATVYSVTCATGCGAGSLDSALAAVNPGDTINMADGNYDLAGSIVESRSGTSGSHITWQSTNYRGAVIRPLNSGSNLVRMNGNYWDIKNIVFDGRSATPANEGVLTIGSTTGSPAPHDITLTGIRIRKSGSAGLMICEAAHDITVTDIHVDGTGYVSLHGEGLYFGSVGAIQYYNISVTDAILEDNTENIIDCHPNGLNISFTRILGRNQTTSAAHGVGGTPPAHYALTVANNSSGVSFTDVTLLDAQGNQNIIRSGTPNGTITFTRLFVNTATITGSLISPTASQMTMTDSEFWNVNNTTVDASSGAGTQSITTTCGTSKSGSGNALNCPTPSTPKFWQRQEAFTASGTSVAKAFTLSVTPGSILTAEIVTGADLSATDDVSDNVNGTWTAGYNSGGKLNFFYKTNVAAGATTVTYATGGAATSIRMDIKQYRGVDASTVLASSNNASATSATVNSGNVTTGQNSNLLIQTCTADTRVTLTKDSNFTLRFFNGGDTLLTADRVPVTGTYSSTCTQSGSATVRSGIANFGPPTATGTIEIGSVPDLTDAVTFTISWSTINLSGGQGVDIFLTRNLGTTYQTIVSNTTDDGAYDWAASGEASSDSWFKICGNTSTSICGFSNTFAKRGGLR